MAVRGPKYPLDVSARFPESVLTAMPVVRARDRISGLVVHPDTDDLTTEVVYKLIRRVYSSVHQTLAYCDIIDLAQEAAAIAHRATDLRLEALEQQAAAIAGDVAATRATVDQLMAFFGVVVPAWINKEEVERGDDMGMDKSSAEALGLLVRFVFDRQVPGFAHEDVLAIEPPAGSLVARGSTVSVTLNLEG